MFDLLTYQKGGAVLRMLEMYLGADEFREGIRRYLDEHRYGNAETTDLWDAIEETTGEPVRATMDSWIFQGGHPLVTVSVAGDGRTLELDQRPFRYLTGGGGGRPWHVPVLYRTEVGGLTEQGRLLLSGQGARAELSGPPDLVLVNAGGSGFYRVRYQDDLFRALVSAFGRLDALERCNLVADTWACVLAGLSPAADFLALARRMGAETDPTVWDAALGALDLIDRVLPGIHTLETRVMSTLTPAERAQLMRLLSKVQASAATTAAETPAPLGGIRNVPARLGRRASAGKDGHTREDA